MTIHIADIASYQLDLPLSALAAAGFTGINVKVSHGIGQKGVHERVGGYIGEARERDWKLSSFHYLTGDADGRAQALYAYGRMFALDLHGAGAVHVLDCEDQTVTKKIFEDYVSEMSLLLDRPFMLYTGDWYEWDRPWAKCGPEMPWLWAAPKIGYLTKYPGDTSEHWVADFADAQFLTAMQYRVGIIGGVKVSQTAVRDEKLWERMSGIMTFAPQSILEVRWEFQRYTNLPNASLGIVRNEWDTSYHVGKSWLESGAYSVNESPRDAHPTDASSAIDIGYFEITVGGKKHTLRDYSRWLVNECKKGAKDTLDIREVIYSLDGETVKRWDREGVRTSGDSSHTSHTHKSWYRDSENRDRAAVTRRWFRDVVFGDNVTPAEFLAILANPEVAARMKQLAGQGWHNMTLGASALTAAVAAQSTYGNVAALLTAVAGIDQVDEGALAAALVPGLATAVLAGLPEGVLTAAEVEQAVRNVLLTGAAPDVG